jgi:hypothetical protein
MNTEPNLTLLLLSNSLNSQSRARDTYHQYPHTPLPRNDSCLVPQSSTSPTYFRSRLFSHPPRSPPPLPTTTTITVATGGSAILAIDVLLKAGAVASKIIFLNVVAAPEGIAAVQAAHPEVRLITAAIDSHLNEDKFIVPGLGDFGDRYYKT